MRDFGVQARLDAEINRLPFALRMLAAELSSLADSLEERPDVVASVYGAVYGDDPKAYYGGRIFALDYGRPSDIDSMDSLGCFQLVKMAEFPEVVGFEIDDLRSEDLAFHKEAMASERHLDSAEQPAPAGFEKFGFGDDIWYRRSDKV